MGKVLSSQESKKLIGKLVKILSDVDWISWRSQNIVGCIVDVEVFDGDVHVWVYWADGLTTWERLGDVHVVLLDDQ